MNYIYLVSFSLFTSVFLHLVNGANILVMLPFPLKSHTGTFMPIFKELASRGHNITFVSPYPQKDIEFNWTNIEVGDYLEKLITGSGGQSLFYFGSNSYSFLYGLWKAYLPITRNILQEEGIQKLIKDENTKFDLMISETPYLHAVFASFAHKFNVPIVNLDAHKPSAWICYLTGNPYHYSYIPSFRIAATDQMTFFERVENTLINLWELFGEYYYVLPKLEQLRKEYFRYPGSESAPPLLDLLRNTSLSLVDTHYSFSYMRPYQANIIEIGGLTLHDNVTLDSDIKTLLDEAEHGAIYMTLGTYLKTTLLPKKTLQVFTSVFEQLPQKILLKWEDSEDSLPNKPKNVKTFKWAQQQGILAHPKCKLFISHGGIHSLTEAAYSGVPVLVIPFFSDQQFNAKYAQSIGFGYVLDHKTLTVQNLLNGINTLLKDPSYKQNAQKRSVILKDRPQSSLDKAVYWIEYVIRHQGASHLRPASMDLLFYQYFLIDVTVFLIFIVILTISVVYFVFKLIIKQMKQVIRTVSKKKQL